MTKTPKARLPKGFHDVQGDTVPQRQALLHQILQIYQKYAFIPLDTSILEFAEALGKFLPDDDRPDEGVFCLQPEGEDWLALRYDLTAPLARYAAQHWQELPKPFKRYQWGPVFRNEKPGHALSRARQFLQADADIVGSAAPAADAEMCMVLAEALEACGLPQAVIQLSSRGLLDGVLTKINLTPQDRNYQQRRLTILRALDKKDRLGTSGVRALLGTGRQDPSGDFTPGAELPPKSIDTLLAFLDTKANTRQDSLAAVSSFVADETALTILGEIDTLLRAAGYGEDRVVVNPSVVRGLDYYTGPVFEAMLPDQEHLGSLGSGGRYDGLVARFGTEPIPATGLSLGLQRLEGALRALQKWEAHTPPVVVVLVLGKTDMPRAQQIAAQLRQAHICAEVYLGRGSVGRQMKYADKRKARIVIIEGEEERAQGVLTVKDLQLGAQQAQTISTRTEWTRTAQQTVTPSELIPTVKKILS